MLPEPRPAAFCTALDGQGSFCLVELAVEASAAVMSAASEPVSSTISLAGSGASASTAALPLPMFRPPKTAAAAAVSLSTGLTATEVFASEGGTCLLPVLGVRAPMICTRASRDSRAAFTSSNDSRVMKCPALVTIMGASSLFASFSAYLMCAMTSFLPWMTSIGNPPDLIVCISSFVTVWRNTALAWPSAPCGVDRSRPLYALASAMYSWMSSSFLLLSGPGLSPSADLGACTIPTHSVPGNYEERRCASWGPSKKVGRQGIKQPAKWGEGGGLMGFRWKISWSCQHLF
mmetsp:Transcript_39441/g.111780  ORF Transcript_39441/g.111780 Transcript_39441/m.111780 type:complete len:290 (-) Transcript_39441:560-1429(-)